MHSQWCVLGPGSPTLVSARVTEKPELSERALRLSRTPATKTGAPTKNRARSKDVQHRGKHVALGNSKPSLAPDEVEKLRKLQDIADRMSSAMEGARLGAARPGFQSLRIGLQMPFGPPVVMGDEYLMTHKGHGTYSSPAQSNLRWNCDHKLADQICNFNRRSAEESGYFLSTSFLSQEPEDGPGSEVVFYDSNTGKPLFFAPRGRAFADFVEESRAHGWPSFRDPEVNWALVRVLPDGETVSVHGTHLGHNLPDGKGHRYCINLVSVAGRPQRGV